MGIDIDKKKGRPSFIEGELRFNMRLDGWLNRNIEILMKIDRSKTGKVGKSWYIRNILNEYCRERQWQIDLVNAALKEVKGKGSSGEGRSEGV